MNKTSMKTIRTFLVGTSLAVGVVVGLAPTGAQAKAVTPIDPTGTIDPCVINPAGCKPPKPPVLIDICKKHPEICVIKLPDNPPPTVPGGNNTPGTTPRTPPTTKPSDPTPPPVVDVPVKGKTPFAG